jgi:hypothetical protein
VFCYTLVELKQNHSLEDGPQICAPGRKTQIGQVGRIAFCELLRMTLFNHPPYKPLHFISTIEN